MTELILIVLAIVAAPVAWKAVKFCIGTSYGVATARQVQRRVATELRARGASDNEVDALADFNGATLMASHVQGLAKALSAHTGTPYLQAYQKLLDEHARDFAEDCARRYEWPGAGLGAASKAVPFEAYRAEYFERVKQLDPAGVHGGMHLVEFTDDEYVRRAHRDGVSPHDLAASFVNEGMKQFLQNSLLDISPDDVDDADAGEGLRKFRAAEKRQ